MGSLILNLRQEKDFFKKASILLKRKAAENKKGTRKGPAYKASQIKKKKKKTSSVLQVSLPLLV